MGAWGCGMKANDTALDAIANAEDVIGVDSVDMTTGEQIRFIGRYCSKHHNGNFGSLFTEIFDEVAAPIDEDFCREATLGIAEWLLDLGFDLSLPAIQQRIRNAIEFEEKLAVNWGNPKERMEALSTFRLRLAAPQDSELAEVSRKHNRALLHRMGDMIRGEHADG